MTNLIFDLESSFDENLEKFRDNLELIDKDLTNILFNHMDILKNAGNEVDGGRDTFNKSILADLEAFEIVNPKKDTK